MYRLRLTRGINNEFFIDQSYIHQKYIRIMEVELNGKKLNSDEFLMKGPRAIQVTIPLQEDDQVYAYVFNHAIGNRIFPHMKR